MERSDLFAVEPLKVLDDLAVAGVVVVHIGDKDDAGQVILLAELPRLLGAHLDAGFSVHDDDGRVGDA